MKKKINKFFRELRKKGYFAKQEFWCCQTCAVADVPEDHADKYVVYSGNDKPSIERGQLYISWSGNGRELCRIAHEYDLKTEWDGLKNSRILLINTVKIPVTSELPEELK